MQPTKKTAPRVWMKLQAIKASTAAKNSDREVK